MREKFKIYIVLLLFISSSVTYAQRENQYNMFGLKIGGSYFNIKTSNFEVAPDFGFLGGFATRGNFYNNWDVQFGINLGNNALKIVGRETALSHSEEIPFSILNAQVHLLFGYKIIGNQRNARSDFKLTAEFGPVLMVNGKMKYSNDRYDAYIIDGTNISAEALQDISGINGNGLIGLSLGAERFRVFGHYQYGFNNILNKLNKIEGNTEDFKGNITMFQFGVLFYF